ncbi:galactitol-1-phosphate 5-dehydrogenase [Pontiella agarivorans]|uniref:Galactitol-1-phosphate 5-dehydrogenase n=1 Tax=Pontiella agarivorans TaxID=3038953 RepID=A0ABU5MT31_9BACT|nr:galactitol-1-phosphate 5-dehydrogenase [Pontiella agarivorans]MDZ8117353.1 galactitol-1-phosphate 5-dehydrogenase [Pontiella agarivorans]
MKAALRNGVKKVDVIEMEKPEPLANEVLIAVKSCGICGSDIVRIQEDNPKWDDIVLGHEFAGEIVAVGENVEGWNVGDRASAAPLMPCMKCDKCAQGNYSLCKGYSFIGSRVQGAFGEFLRVPAQNLVAIGNLSYDQAAFIEPITVCLHPILRLENLLGKDVVVTGAGTIGLLAIQIFKAMGCRDIVASDISDGKLEMARAMGATIVCNPMKEPLEEVCERELEDGAHVVFESSGAGPAKISAINVAKGRGKILLVGTSHAPITFTGPEFERISRQELEVIGSWMNYSAPFPGKEWTTAAWMMDAGLIDVAPLQTHTFPIEQIQDAYDVIYKNDELWAKVMINF